MWALMPTAVQFTTGIPAVIAEETPVLEEVIVVARRREENLQQTPIAVTAMGTDELRAAQIDNLGDLTRVAPGLTRNEGSRSGFLAIRGVGQQNPNVRFEPGVGVYVDNIYLPRADTQLVDIVNPESVQVLRGPQGTLFGRNTIGGAILVNSTRPGQQFAGFAEMDIGDLDRRKFRAGVSGPLIDDTLYAGVTVSRAREDGYREDAITDVDYGDTNKDAVLAQFRYETGNMFTGDLMLFWSEQDENAAPQTCEVVNPSAALFSLTAPGVAEPYGELCEASHSLNKDEEVLMDRITARFEQENMLAGLTLSWDLESATIRSITGYLGQDNITKGDDTDATNLFTLLNGSELRRQALGSGIAGDDQERTFFSQEFQLTGTALGDLLDYTVGVFYSSEKIDNNLGGVVTGPGGWIGVPVGSEQVLPVTAGARAISLNDYDNTSIAAFTQLNFNLSDMWQVTLGGRYTYEEKESSQANYNTQTPNPGLLSREEFDELENFLQDYTLTDVQEAEDDWTEFSPAVSVSMFFPEEWYNDTLSDGMLYLSGASGFKAGGFAPFVDERLTAFDPETLWTYEFGFKLDLLSQRVRLNGALYYSDYQDMQLNVTRTDFSVDPPAVDDGIINAGEATISGVELELSFLPFEGLFVSLTGSYINAEYDEFHDEDSDGNVLDRSDEDFPYIPEYTFSVLAQYDWLTDFGLISPRISGHYVDEIYYGVDIAAATYEQAYLDDRTTWNLRLAWLVEPLSENLEVAAYVMNFTDEEYFASGFITVDSVGASSLIAGKQRTWGVTARYSW
jgi:iron complex outermembrane receptor protein